jgi:hypothetical protein
MTIEYTLDKVDFLTFQLYSASKSERIRKIRTRNKMMLPLVYLGISIILYFIESIELAIIIFLSGLLWILIYPFYDRRKYVKHYEKYILEIYKNRLGKPENLKFEGDYVHSSDFTGETKMYLSELEELNEISDYYYLKFNSGVSLIIPKRKVDNIESLDQFLNELATRLGIKHNIELNWRWK